MWELHEELVRMGGLTPLTPTLLHTALVILHIIYTLNHEMIVLLQILNIPKNYYLIYSHIKQYTYVGNFSF